ncbi:MAG: translocation/assembly module TamB domain-containing protein [Tenuifilum sp.]|uniref:translocation/assembly module TamB domain-containing protein n=1 Tax=Tenuifilum sp. TaxID=2760880 RepID=UPI0030958964
MNNDTLIYAKRVIASISQIDTDAGLFRLGKARVDNAKFYLITDSSGVTNLNALLLKINSDTTQSPDSGRFNLQIGNIVLKNSRFKLSQQGADSLTPGTINFQNLVLSGINLEASEFNLDGDTIGILINGLTAQDHSGFKIDNLRSKITICSKFMHFNNLRLRANGSSLSMNHLLFDFDGWDSFSNFTSRVRINADFEGTYLHTSTLAYIVTELKNYSVGLRVTGQVKGYVDDLRARNLELGFGNISEIALNANLTGLPKIDNTLFSVDLKKLQTSRKDLLQFKVNGSGKPLIDLPEELDRLGLINYVGRFSGYLSDFVTYGTLTSALGAIDFDVWMKPGKTIKNEFKGKASANNFKLGQLLNENLIGSLSFLSSISGTVNKQGELRAFTDAHIRKLEANGYDYKDIDISGNLGNNSYTGTINLNDPNCKLNFLGRVDFSDTIPVFDFSLFAPRIDLVELNLNRVDSVSVASFLLTAKFSGNTLDNSKGEIKLVNSTYRNQRGEFKIADLTITADNTNESKVITLKSDIAEGEIRSRQSFSRFPYYMNKVLSRHLPALRQDESNGKSKTPQLNAEEYNDYLIKFRLKKTQKVTSILAPDLSIAENSSLFGILDPNKETLTFKLKVLELVTGSTVFKNLSVDGETRDSILEANVLMPEIKVGNSYIRNLKVNATTQNNTVRCNINWNNYSTPSTLGDINLIADFKAFSQPNSTIYINFLPSSLIINDSTWNLSPSLVRIDSSTIQFSNFALSNKHQLISITGKASQLNSDTIAVTLKNIDLSYLNFYLHDSGYKLSGWINGDALATGILLNPILQAKIGIDKFVVNNQNIGDVKFQSTWHGSENRINLLLSNQRTDTLTLLAKGDYFTDNGNFNFDVNINQAKLALIAPLLEGNVSNLQGRMNGSLKIKGDANKPIVDGSIGFDNAGLTIDFLQTHYTLSDKVTINNSNIVLNNFRLTDRFNRTSAINGTIQTNYFKNFNLGLRLSMQNFLCMNTRETDNETFYGTVFASGFVDFLGSPDNLNLNINLKTENRTAIYLPLTSTSTVEESNFISFVNNNPDLIEIEEAVQNVQTSSSNINITMDLQVTPEAEAQIIIDKKLGDIIKANGSGSLRMEINPSKDVFRMFGRYTIEQGDYLFTLSGVINKRFRIEQGSYIDWNGDPLDANMDIKAVYRVKTSLKQLLLDDSYTARVPVDCKIMLSQKLLTPSIKFGIDFPNLDQQTKALVDGMLNTEEKINTQFLGLLVINSFISDPGMTAAGTQTSNASLGTTGLYNTASELLSNQLSNWLSQWSKNFDIGINYRPGLENELSSDQVEMALSTQILDDRVSISSNVGVGGNKNSSNALVGDFTVDIKLNKSGKLRGKAFARNNNDVLLTSQQNNYTTGAGIVYREDFNTIRELFNSIFSKDKRYPNDTKHNDSSPNQNSSNTKLPDTSFVKIN